MKTEGPECCGADSGGILGFFSYFLLVRTTSAFSGCRRRRPWMFRQQSASSSSHTRPHHIPGYRAICSHGEWEPLICRWQHVPDDAAALPDGPNTPLSTPLPPHTARATARPCSPLPPCVNTLPTPQGLARSHSVVQGGREEVLRQMDGEGKGSRRERELEEEVGGGSREERKSSGGKQRGKVQQLLWWGEGPPWLMKS